MNFEGGMNLNEVIAELERMHPEGEPEWGFGKPHSYRGYYECLAFEPMRDASVKQMLASARGAVGATYEGYKGGEYRMDGWTECYLANYGSTGNAITPVLFDYMRLCGADEPFITDEQYRATTGTPRQLIRPREDGSRA